MKPILQIIPSSSNQVGLHRESNTYQIIHVQPANLIKTPLKSLVPATLKWNFIPGQWDDQKKAYVSKLETEVDTSK
jgi:hypothetical protein